MDSLLVPFGATPLVPSGRNIGPLYGSVHTSFSLEAKSETGIWIEQVSSNKFDISCQENVYLAKFEFILGIKGLKTEHLARYEIISQNKSPVLTFLLTLDIFPVKQH